jgi:hypothetical protein
VACRLSAGAAAALELESTVEPVFEGGASTGALALSEVGAVVGAPEVMLVPATCPGAVARVFAATALGATVDVAAFRVAVPGCCRPI